MTTNTTNTEVSSKRLECIQSENLTGAVISSTGGCQINPTILQFSHGTNFSDGDIYRKVRQYQKEKNDNAANEWIQRLSKCKQVGLKCLLENEGIVNALDALLEYPGLWIGLELGNIRRILAMHCDKEIIRYLGHVKNIWSQITLKKASLKRTVDVGTVKMLQLRAPAVSIIDRDFVGTVMDSGVLFASIADPETRVAIKDAIDKIPCMIPSIKTLHENSKLLGLGSKIIGELIIGRPLRTSLHNTLFENWKAPKDMVVEVADGEFCHTESPSNDFSWNLVYKQIWISALRNSSELSGVPPRKEKGGDTPSAEINLSRRHQFVLFVSRLGLRTSKTREQLKNNPDREALRHCMTQILSTQCPSLERQEDMLDHMQQALHRTGEQHQALAPCFATSHCSESLERRWGRPFQNSYLSVQRQSFLPNLISTVPPDSHKRPTPFFVRKDFLDAFFGTTAKLTLSETTDKLLSWSNPVGSTTENEDDNYNGPDKTTDNGPENTTDIIDRMSIDLADHEIISVADNMRGVLTIASFSSPSGPVHGENSFESSVNFMTERWTDMPNHNLPLPEAQDQLALNQEFSHHKEQPRSPIDPQVESSPPIVLAYTSTSVPEYASASQMNLVEQSEELALTSQDLTITDSLPLDLSGNTTHIFDHPRSPITIAYQMTPSKLSLIQRPESTTILDEDYKLGNSSSLAGYPNQLPLDQASRYRRSPIGSINQNAALDIPAKSRQVFDVIQTDRIPQGPHAYSEIQFNSIPRDQREERAERHLLDDSRSSNCAAARNFTFLDAPASQAMPSSSVTNTEALSIFGLSAGIPETSLPNTVFDKVVEMTDIFNSDIGTSNMSDHFVSGKGLSKSSYRFIFYNGMTLNSSALTKEEMGKYLQKRPSSVMLAANGNSGPKPLRNRQVWRSIPRRQILAQMLAEPHLTYVLTVPEKAQWWIVNGTHLLKEKKLYPRRKHRFESPNVAKIVENEQAVTSNPWIHSHNSESLNILSKIIYPAGTDIMRCETDLISSRLELPSAYKVLQYDEAKVRTLVTFDKSCRDQPCFQNYFRGYRPIFKESQTTDNTEQGENSKAIIWMVDSRVALSFEEERHFVPRAKLATKRGFKFLDIGGPFSGENDLFDDDEGKVEGSASPRVSHIEQLPSNSRYVRPTKSSVRADLPQSPSGGMKTANKRSAEETEERSRTILLAMPSQMEVQEPKRHKDESYWVDIERPKTPPLAEEKLFGWEVIEL